MPDRHETYQVTCPANTPKSTPLEQLTRFQPGLVSRVEIRWPAGHASLTGIQIAAAHQPVIPFGANQYLVGDNRVRFYEPTNPPQTGHWSVFMYNLDNRDHYWEVTYEVDLFPRNTSGAMGFRGPLPVGDIYAAVER